MLDESHQAVGAAGAALNLGLADDDRGTRGGDVIADGQKEIVKLLTAKGANVNAKDDRGRSPLHDVARKEVAELLIANGANVNAKDDRGSTPLHKPANNGYKEIVELLIQKGADVNAKDGTGLTPLDYAKRHPEIANLLRKHGGKTGEELKAEGK